MKTKTKRMIIEDISRFYLKKRHVLEQSEAGYTDFTGKEIDEARAVVSRVDVVVDHLDEQDRFIIYHEVVLGKVNHWYQNYLSESTYYRHRQIAYERFIQRLS